MLVQPLQVGLQVASPYERLVVAHEERSRPRVQSDRRAMRPPLPSQQVIWTSPGADPNMGTRFCGAKAGDKGLFTSSTVALNPDTGKLDWYFQHVPGESFDMDEVFERVVVDIGEQKLLFTIGKAGILWKLNRAGRRFLDSRETVFQNLFRQSKI